MLPYFSDIYGNPSSGHRFGQQADRALKTARRTIANRLHCAPSEIVFTSCASESNNLALRGFALETIRQGQRPHLITALTEHHAVSHTARQIADTFPCEVTFMPVDHVGRVTPEVLCTTLRAIQPTGARMLVSLMLANNEIGTRQPIGELAAIAHGYGALFHTDAVQAAGQIPIDVQALGIDLLSLTGHKFYAPKGVGLLYVRESITLIPSQSGGGQESDRRAGTQNMPLIVGMAAALDLASEELELRVGHYTHLRDRLIDGVLTRVPGAEITGHPTERLPNHASFVIPGVEGNALLMHLDTHGIAASSGSACNTGSPEPSEVLIAMGYPADLALGSLRLTVGKQTTDAEIDRVLEVLPTSVEKLRAVFANQFLA
jgi:cysteine desulfurase